MDQLTSSLAGEAAAVDGVALKLESSPSRLSGFISAAGIDQDPLLSLMFGSVLLGTMRSDQREPSAGREHERILAFDIPDHGLRTFARVAKLGELGIVAGLEGQSLRIALPQSAGAASPLGTRHKSTLGFRLADAWLESSRDLTLRFELDGNVAKTLDAYQCSFDSLVSVAAARPIGGLNSLATITLINPFAPLLLVFKGEDASIDAIDFVPFPSLLRGGLHSAERLIAAFGADDIADAAALSAELVEALLVRLEEPEQCVTSISIHTSIHTGVEPILNDDLLSWLTGALGVAVEVDKSRSDSAPPSFIEEFLSRFALSEAPRGHRLHLPADCIPTLASLLRPLPRDAAPGMVTGGLGIVDSSRHGRVWSVWQPPFSHVLEGAQFAEGDRLAPAIEVRPHQPAADPRDISLDWPLGLAFRDLAVRMARNSPFEIASDYDSSLLREGEPAGPHSLTVVVLHSRQAPDPIPLIESVVRQSGIRIEHLVLCRPEGADEEKLVSALERVIEGGHTMLPVSETMGRIEQIVAARPFVTSDVVLLVDAQTVLPDRRTVSALAQMLNVAEVASAGCLLRSANEKMSSLAAGYSFAQLDFRAVPGATFGAIDPAIWREPCTYPVVANPLAALVTRRELLNDVSAAGSVGSRPQSDDVLFGIQLIERGGINVCTTIVSAFTESTEQSLRLASIAIPYRLSVDELVRIARASMAVQRIA